MFKKRARKEVPLRKKEKDEEGGEEGGERGAREEDDTTPVIDIGMKKLQQSMRKRANGVDVNALRTKVAKGDPGSAPDGSADVGKSSAAGVGSKFESRVDIGLTNTPSVHEDIMEEYIRNKMGENDPEITTQKAAGAQGRDDAEEEDGARAALSLANESMSAYAISQELKTLVSGQTDNGRPRSDSVSDMGPAGAGASVGALLAEVALPERYKIENIVETEKAKARERIRMRGKKVGDEGSNTAFRFMNYKRRSGPTTSESAAQGAAGMQTGPEVASVPTAKEVKEAAVGKSKYKGPMASDNKAFTRFIKLDEQHRNR